MGPGDRHDDEPLDDHDEGADDESAAPRGAPPDPMDRVWVHPTELPLTAGAPSTASAAPAREPGHRRGVNTVVVGVLAGVAGALVTVLVLSLTGSLDQGSNSNPNPSASGATGGLKSTAADAAARLGVSIVAVAARDGKGSRQGSGVCVRHGSEVLTAAHIVGNANTVDIVTSDGQRHSGKVKGRDAVTDLALISLDTDVPAAQLADHAPAAGTNVWVLGAAAPGTRSTWMSGGMVATTDAMLTRSEGPKVGGLLETDAAIGAAATGGALIDDGGRVTGIVLGRFDAAGTTYAVPIATAVAVAEELHNDGEAKHGWLGLTGVDTSYGPTVAAMDAKGPAARAGVRRGDVVDTFDGRIVESTADLMAMMRTVDPGQTVMMELNRGSDTVKVRVTLAAARS